MVGAGGLLSAVSGCWPLLLGMALVMLGNGLQGPLLALRATAEDFGASLTGLVMSGYFAGFALGSFLVPRLVQRVGHVRVFAALASLASIAILLHPFLMQPYIWIVLRIMTGFAFAGIYVVAESWLNDAVPNRHRGRMLAVYMVITMSCFGVGPLALNLADTNAMGLFVAVSVLVSLALVPILLTAGRAPAFDAPEKLRLKRLWGLSPLGVVSCLLSGATQGAIMGMGAVFAGQMGLSLSEISQFMALVILGPVVLQWPIGYLSDRFDRRIILTGVTLGAGLLAGLAAVIAASEQTSGSFWLLFAFAYGGFGFSLYSLNVAYINDRVPARQMVSASAAIVLLTGVGGMFGPLIGAQALGWFGGPGFLSFLAIVHGGTVLFALYRMSRSKATAMADQTPAVFLSRPSAVAVSTAMEIAQESLADDGETAP